MEPSVFTKIVNGEIPCHKVYEDDLTLAFLDIHPFRLGHTLVIPKQQIDHFDELPEELRNAVFATAQKISRALREHFGTRRTVMLTTGFEVPHVHVHLIPADDESSIVVAMNTREARAADSPDHAKLEKIATDLREVI